eukprot:9261533-Ditylum_brightwellii.AAC.1
MTPILNDLTPKLTKAYLGNDPPMPSAMVIGGNALAATDLILAELNSSTSPIFDNTPDFFT